jgi:hypothetical protein
MSLEKKLEAGAIPGKIFRDYIARLDELEGSWALNNGY